LRALSNQLRFKFCQGGENPKHQAAVRRCGINLGTAASQHLEADLTLAQVIHQTDQVFEVSPKSIELPDHKRIARLQGLEASSQTRTVIFSTGGQVFVEALGGPRPRPTGHPAGGSGFECRRFLIPACSR
jgi:hypothetical protein